MKRRLILVDVENVNGGPLLTRGQATWCRRAVEQALGQNPGDQVVVASEAMFLVNVFPDWSGPRFLGGSGENGADLRLLEVMDENLAVRFRELVLVSGDGIFADRVSRLALEGLPTTVCCHPTALSVRLQIAATHCIPLVSTTQDPSYPLQKEVA